MSLSIMNLYIFSYSWQIFFINSLRNLTFLFFFSFTDLLCVRIIHIVFFVLYLNSVVWQYNQFECSMLCALKRQKQDSNWKFENKIYVENKDNTCEPPSNLPTVPHFYWLINLIPCIYSERKRVFHPVNGNKHFTLCGFSWCSLKLNFCLLFSR